MEQAAFLRLCNVVKSYDGMVNAVDDISIDIARGEFLTFLGPSGSGKTTTLMMIAGFQEITSGTIEIEGQSLARKRPYERNIGMVFQSYALFPHMTAAQNIAFPLRMRRLPKAEIEQGVKKVLDLVGLGKFAGKRPREMSGGQQQRVALARSIVFNPDVLLLDEPLGALDRNLREQMQVEIKRIHREVGITTIYVTHDQTEAMTMSDRIAVFGEGKVRQIAPPKEIYNRPTSRFVGEFIGDSNFFEAPGKFIKPGHVRNYERGFSSVGEYQLAGGRDGRPSRASRAGADCRPRGRSLDGAVDHRHDSRLRRHRIGDRPRR